MIMIAQKVNIVSILLADTVFVRNVKTVITTTEREMADPVLKVGMNVGPAKMNLKNFLKPITKSAKDVCQIRVQE